MSALAQAIQRYVRCTSPPRPDDRIYHVFEKCYQLTGAVDDLAVAMLDIAKIAAELRYGRKATAALKGWDEGVATFVVIKDSQVIDEFDIDPDETLEELEQDPLKRQTS